MGKTLSEQELCAELGLGRTPVREALQLLASEGLVVIMPRKGAYVSNVSFTDFQKIFETRMMLESYCVPEAAKKISATEIDHLRSLLSDIPRLVDLMDIDALLSIDRQIHMGVIRSLMNQYVEQVAEQIYDLVTRTWYLSFRTKTPEEVFRSAMSHHEILDALQQRDPAKAARANRKHLEQFIAQIYHSVTKEGSTGNRLGTKRRNP
jgi:DNA-binding GntR family transcriptional regulator